jgi:hypothetical protein
MDVVQGCLGEVARAADRVSRCSRAALERAVGDIGADVKAVKSSVDGIQGAIADGVTRLESRWREVDAGNTKHLHTVAENSRKMLEVADQMLKLGWYQQQYLGSVGKC